VEYREVYQNFFSGSATYALFGPANGNARLNDSQRPNSQRRIAQEPTQQYGQFGLSFLQATPDTGDSCLNACPPGSPDCQTSAVNDNVRVGLDKLLQRANHGELALAPNEMRTLFQIADDPCGRGPTAITMRGVANVGSPCRVDARVGDDLTLHFDVPAKVEASWSLRSSSLMKLTFDKEEYAPALHFLDNLNEPTLLDKDFGGKIKFAEADTRRLFVKTTGGCVGVRTK